MECHKYVGIGRFKKDDEINAWSAVIFAVKILYEIICSIKINGSIFFTKEIVFRGHSFEANKFNDVSFIRTFGTYESPTYILLHMG